MVEIAGSNPAGTTERRSRGPAATAPPLHGEVRRFESCREYCGVDWSWFPARSHKPFDAGSNPASAIWIRGWGLGQESDAHVRPLMTSNSNPQPLTPNPYTRAAGPIWYDSWFAPRQSGFNSPAVHCLRRFAPMVKRTI